MSASSLNTPDICMPQCLCTHFLEFHFLCSPFRPFLFILINLNILYLDFNSSKTSWFCQHGGMNVCELIGPLASQEEEEGWEDLQIMQDQPPHEGERGQ